MPENAPSSTSVAALDRLRPLLLAIPEADLELQTGLDIVDAAGKVIGNLGRIQALRGAALETFLERGAGYFDRLPDVANAAQQAGIEYLAAESDTKLTDAMAQLTVDHKVLVGDLDSLANRELIERVEVGRTAQGYAGLINSTLVLVTLFRKLLPRVADSTGMKVADLDRIEERANRLFKQLNERNEGSDRDAAGDLRTRALTHLIKEYGEVRRMVLYIRHWQGDPDEIAPSLWAGRKRKKGTEPPEPEPIPEPGPTGGPGPFTT